jgi:hypothetical protein
MIVSMAGDGKRKIKGETAPSVGHERSKGLTGNRIIAGIEDQYSVLRSK